MFCLKFAIRKVTYEILLSGYVFKKIAFEVEEKVFSQDEVELF